MKIYPYTTPIIMTDDAFQKYGGNLANTSVERRKAAYVIAEMAATEDIGSFLIPTTITGSFVLSPTRDLSLDYGYVTHIGAVKFYDFEGNNYYTAQSTDYAIRNQELGIIDLNYYLDLCGCHSSRMLPYRIEIAYTAGLSTGTSTMPNMLLALTTYSQIILNEILGYGNESPGDIGVEEYQNQGYRENRIALFRTVYGSSPKALFVHRLLTDLRQYRQVGL